MIIIKDLIQGSNEWLQARCGVISASCFNKLITPTGKLTTGKTRGDYMLDLVHEQITKTPVESFSSSAMQRGNDLEPDARNAFEFINEVVVDEVGIAYLDDKKEVSCSPDGLLGMLSGVEIKCPLHKVHLQTLIDNEMPKNHIQQVQGSMLVTGRKSWWFVSYHPQHRIFIKEIKRDNDYISKLEKAVNIFNLELKELKNKIEDR